MTSRLPLLPPRVGVWLLWASLFPGCGLLFPDPGPGSPFREEDPGLRTRSAAEGELWEEPALPLGLGTLRQEEISVDLRRGELQIRVTPLAESVTRTAAPDTWERLSNLARSYRDLWIRETGSDPEWQLFLVAFYSSSLTLPFEPGALSLVSQGVRHRPLDIRPISPSWTFQRVLPREPQLGLYAFPLGVDLEGDLAVEYQETRSLDWERVLPLIQTERGRIRARTPREPVQTQASIPYF